ncbi:MAG TPA: type II toxin-antitoxin system VapC family toxin [Blastocatellia bacterium]
MGSIDSIKARQAIADFEGHFRAEYSVTPLTRQIIDRSMTLAPLRALRGYDAVQLATGLTVNDYLASAGIAPITFVSSDADLNAAAAQEGLTVDDPQTHSDPWDLSP